MKANRRVLFAVMLALFGGMSACDRTDGAGGLTGLAAPQFAVNGNNNNNGNNGKTGNSIKILTSTNPLTQDVYYETKNPINNKGGRLVFGTNILDIGQSAVQGPTLFGATIRAGAEIRVDLRAWEPNGTPVTTFKRPILLTLDLSAVPAEVDLKKVKIFYLNPNGTYEAMPSTVNLTAKTVTATLSHFSDYSPGL